MDLIPRKCISGWKIFSRIPPAWEIREKSWLPGKRETGFFFYPALFQMLHPSLLGPLGRDWPGGQPAFHHSKRIHGRKWSGPDNGLPGPTGFGRLAEHPRIQLGSGGENRSGRKSMLPAVSLKTSVIILISVTLFMGVLITIAVSRTISTPILSLKNGVEIIGKGDFDYQINMKPSNEIGRLALAFNQMAKNLKSITASRDQLNREVEKRIQTEKDLGKRINELNCLFNLSKLIEQKGLSIEGCAEGNR